MKVNRKVAIYARVSTEHEAQLSALDNQVQYYDEILNKHPNWILYDRYIDEGITGTSIKKRKNFIRMMKDAHEGKFDLIITREVSRFARNTVDTLQETRKLKKLGVEVYFTEDNIWTFKDDDGELKLTIMATLAQNESKKTSQRVKAGLKVAFMNGIFMGSGNILGYEKIDKNTMVVNEEQAEIVRYIFSEYINGVGTSTIAKDLEKKGYKTSTGLNRWTAAYITRVLRNQFYSGTIVYNKQYIPDYLEQKARKNRGEIEQIVVEGTHEPIISKEDFEKAQAILDRHTKPSLSGDRTAIGVPKYVWSKKMICECGSTFNRRKDHVTSKGKTYAYGCYNRKTHPKGGNYEYGYKYCEVKEVQEWKLEKMAEFIFRNLIEDNHNRTELELILLNGIKIDTHEADELNDKIKRYNKVIKEESIKLDRLLNLYLDKKVNPSEYESFQKKLSDKIELYKLEIEDLEKELKRLDPPEVKIEKAKQSVRRLLDFNYNGINDILIEEVVDKIIVHKEWFEWKLVFLNEPINLEVKGKKQDYIIVEHEK